MAEPWERAASDEVSFGHVELPDPSASDQPPAETDDGAGETGGGRDRLPLILMAVVAVCALVTTAIVALTARTDEDGTHHLSADHAACFDMRALEPR